MQLYYSNNFELLIAVMLSAQCTDKMVNVVTKKLFKKYTTLDEYLNADPREFEQDIYQTGFFRSKTKHILASAHIIKQQFNGEIPATMDEMLTLPGVARKTANVVLGNAFGVVEGIAVDTHVKRFANLYGLSPHSSPLKIEKDLMNIIPREEWFAFTYRVIEYGRTYCPARRHDHLHCPLNELFKTCG